MSQTAYQSRINKVLDFIELHLDQNLSLGELADVAAFSRFHFHRIFRAMMGDSVGQYVNRVRLERATRLLIYHPGKTITEIALECGFSSQATFARAFKTMFGISASEYRDLGETGYSKIRKTDSNPGQSPGKDRKAFRTEMVFLGVNVQPQWKITMNDQWLTNVEVKDLPEMTLAYVRHIGPYAGNTELFGQLFQKLYGWAGARGLLNFPKTRTYAVYHDDPMVTEAEKLRLTLGITVAPDTLVDGEIGKMTMAAGKYALATFEITADQYEEIWSAMYQSWLPNSGYQPADGPSFEHYLNDPGSHPEGKHIVEIGIPVEPAAMG